MNLDGSPEQCFMAAYCRNSVDNVGVEHNKCHSCRLSPAYIEETHNLPSYWKPLGQFVKVKHPTIENAKRRAAQERADARKKARQAKDRKRQALLKKAERAERQTERNIIRATRNSGRSLQDGDHTMGTLATLDTKLQSRRTNPVVQISELTKVRADAVRAGTLFGALVLTSKNGVSVVAMLDKDFAIIMEALRNNHKPEGETDA